MPLVWSVVMQVCGACPSLYRTAPQPQTPLAPTAFLEAPDQAENTQSGFKSLKV